MKNLISKILTMSFAILLMVVYLAPSNTLANTNVITISDLFSNGEIGDFSPYLLPNDLSLISHMGSDEKSELITIGNINYRIVVEASGGVGFVRVANNQDLNVANLEIPASIKFSNSVYKVIGIDDYAFFGNDNIKTVSIPSSVTLIGNYVFSDCENLESFDVDKSSEYFVSLNDTLFTANKSTLLYYPIGKNSSSYSLPSGVSKIQNGAFYNATKLDTFTVSTDLREIGDYAFANSTLSKVTGIMQIEILGDYTFANSLLSSYQFTSTLEEMGVGCFANTNLENISLPYKLTIVPKYAFLNCNSLKTVEFPSNLRDLKLIDSYAFAGTGLKKVSLNNSLETIGYRAFANCIDLIIVELNENLKNIEDEAFLNCSGIQSMKFYSSMLSLAPNAFTGCYSLSEISATGIRYIVEDNILYDASKTEILLIAPYNRTSLTILEQTSKADYDLFLSLNKLEEFIVDDGNKVFSTENGILYNKDKSVLIKYPEAKNLAIVNFLDETKEISPNAFANASKISKQVNIGKNIETIGENAFLNTQNISSFYVTADNKKFSSLDGVLYNKNFTSLIKFPESKKLNSFQAIDTVMSIEKGAFYNASITEFVASKNLIVIYENAFENSTLSRIIFNEEISQIKPFAFKNSGLTSVSIPSSVKNVGNFAFSNCYKLDSITLNSSDIGATSNTFLNNSAIRKIYVKSSDLNAYKRILSPQGIRNIDKVLVKL